MATTRGCDVCHAMLVRRPLWCQAECLALPGGSRQPGRDGHGLVSLWPLHAAQRAATEGYKQSKELLMPALLIASPLTRANVGISAAPCRGRPTCGTRWHICC